MNVCTCLRDSYFLSPSLPSCHFFVVEHHLIFRDALHILLHSSDQNTTVYKSNRKHEALLSEKKRLNPKTKTKTKYSLFFALPAICLYVHAFPLVRLKHTLFHICDGIHYTQCTESGCTTSWIKCAKNDIAPISTHSTDYLLPLVLLLLLFVLKFYRRKKSTRQTWKNWCHPEFSLS